LPPESTTTRSAHGNRIAGQQRGEGNRAAGLDDELELAERSDGSERLAVADGERVGEILPVEAKPIAPATVRAARRRPSRRDAVARIAPAATSGIIVEASGSTMKMSVSGKRRGSHAIPDDSRRRRTE